jgi:D-serine deaminase-like pyridoxal phosphate-dependent protein
VPVQEAVSTTAKHAIGEVQTPSNLAPAVGDHADFVILHKCSSVAEAVLNPPHDRTVIKGGKIVSRRKAEIWMNR